MAAPVNKVEAAHQLYRDNRYNEALDLYTDALAIAKTNSQKIALHSNRAACYLKLHDFKKAADECTSVLELDQNHTGALMLRAQTLVTLKEYQFALFDVNRLMEFNPSSKVYTDLQARLKTQLSLAPIPESETEVEEEEDNKWNGTPEMDSKIVQDREQTQKGQSFSTEKNEKACPNNVSIHTLLVPLQERLEGLPNSQTKGWTTIPKPVGHSKLDYSSWDRVEDDLSEEDEDGDSENEKACPNNLSIHTSPVLLQERHKGVSHNQNKGWMAIPRPMGHSKLDYSRWDKVEEDLSEEDEDGDSDSNDEDQPCCRFRVKTIGINPVK